MTTKMIKILGIASLCFNNQCGYLCSIRTLSTQALVLLCLALPQAALTDNGDGTVTDTATGLMWAQCSQGQSGAACATKSKWEKTCC